MSSVTTEDETHSLLASPTNSDRGSSNQYYHCASSKGDTSRKFHCDVCNKVCHSNWKLSAHMLTHSGERPFQCSLCSSTFTRKNSLINHLKTHSSNKEFSCDVDGCGRSFRLKSDLKRHCNSHLDYGKFPCPLCNADLRSSSARATHIKSHAGIKQFQCRECKKSFVTSSKLTCHMRIHSGELPFACAEPNCDRRFAEQSSLRKHLLAHEPKEVKRYKCDYCTKAYRNSSALAAHRRKLHANLVAMRGRDSILRCGRVGREDGTLFESISESEEGLGLAGSPSAYLEVGSSSAFENLHSSLSDSHLHIADSVDIMNEGPSNGRLISLRTMDESRLAAEALLRTS